MPAPSPSSEQLQARIDTLEKQVARHDLELVCFELLRSRMAEGFCVLELLMAPKGR